MLIHDISFYCVNKRKRVSFWGGGRMSAIYPATPYEAKTTPSLLEI